MTPEVYDHIASSPAIITHVAAGSIGIVSGAVALFSRKGAFVHRAAGTVFFIAMLTTAAMATYLAIPIPQRGNAIGGIFTCYLVATAWMTVGREEGRIGLFERGAPLVALAAAAALLTFGVQGVNSRQD